MTIPAFWSLVRLAWARNQILISLVILAFALVYFILLIAVIWIGIQPLLHWVGLVIVVSAIIFAEKRTRKRAGSWLRRVMRKLGLREPISLTMYYGTIHGDIKRYFPDSEKSEDEQMDFHRQLQEMGIHSSPSANAWRRVLGLKEKK